ncbi:hypothetical protein QAD02_006824, partial [Eretmocerus hayati]
MCDTANQSRKFQDDHVFQEISKLLTLKVEDKAINNRHLFMVERDIIPHMKKADDLFAHMYKEIVFGGSYYKGTKFGKPDEYDLLMVVKLPIDYSKIIIDTDHENYAYVKFKVDKNDISNQLDERSRKIISKWITADGYLNQNRFREWMQGVFTKGVDRLPINLGLFNKSNLNCNSSTQENFRETPTTNLPGPRFSAQASAHPLNINNQNPNTCPASTRENLWEIPTMPTNPSTPTSIPYIVQTGTSGPAFPVKMITPEGCMISIDLVPALEFENIPLGNGYRKLNGTKYSWLTVAKPIKDDLIGKGALWRVCFYKQEKAFLKDDLNGEIKPVIRMMKKFRDTQNWKGLCSYFIETIFYHMLDRQHNDQSESLARCTRTWIFIKALKELEKAMQTKTLRYFWHPKFNLFEKLPTETLENWAHSLRRIINKIEGDFEDNPYVLADVVLGGNGRDKLAM